VVFERLAWRVKAALAEVRSILADEVDQRSHAPRCRSLSRRLPLAGAQKVEPMGVIDLSILDKKVVQATKIDQERINAGHTPMMILDLVDGVQHLSHVVEVVCDLADDAAGRFRSDFWPVVIFSTHSRRTIAGCQGPD
jgi:hypothetical protein